MLLRHLRPGRLIVGLLVLACCALGGVAAERAEALPPGFQDSVAISGLTNPIAVRFASDGRVFVAEKSGLIKVYDGVSDATPTVFADLSTNTYNFWDRGLLGLALHPDFPATPYVYALYAFDATIGGTAPRWGTPGVFSDPCPNPPGATGDGCVVSGRLSRLEAAGDVMTGSERVLVEDWCQQYPSHSVGDLAFGADGALYVSGGDGASFNFTDYGQDGSPVNPCGDPPGGTGAALTPPTAEGGALRSQDLRTASDPTSLDGTILRLDPLTGAGMPDNPLSLSPDPNARRIVAQGLRNPFRIAVRPGTSEVWAGDVGWNTWEELNRLAASAASVVNFGWPCYEGAARQSGYDGANLNICENLYAAGAGAVANAHYAYDHAQKVVAGETCPTGSSSTAGLAFYPGGAFPDAYDGALFFADYSRRCIWVMRAGAGGLPDPATRETFLAAAANPVDLEVGPDGKLYYVDLNGGTVHRVEFFQANQPPVAAAAATPTSGSAPLAVAFDGSGSSDPDAGETLAYAWDLDGDGAFDDSTEVAPSFTYTVPGTVTAGLQVTDAAGASDTDTVAISVDNTAPVASIDSPAVGTMWRVGDEIVFAGSASDAEEGALPPPRLSWSVILHHCPSNCHAHPVQDFAGTASGSFTAPDHEYPSRIELRLTATDSGGLSDVESIFIDPRSVTLTFASVPTGMSLVVGGAAGTAPFDRTVIVGSSNSVSAPSPQTLGASTYDWSSWSDGLGQTHTVVAGATPETHTATYAEIVGCAVGQYRAEYFSNQTLSGSPALVRCEAAIANDWGSGGPAGGIGPDRFSSRWTGRFAFGAGSYTFTARADDGVRVWIDGELVIDRWIDQAATTYTATRTLTAGEHEVRMEYFENGGLAVAQLSWANGGCPVGQFRADYFANRTLSGAPVFTRCEGRPNYNWGSGGPGNGVPKDNFSARWTGRVSFPAGSRTFTTRTDDGVRLYLDGVAIINKWVDQSARSWSATRTLTAGGHELRMEYYERGGSAVAQLTY